MLKVHIAFHDITPIHSELIGRGLEVLKNSGVEKLTCLFVPDYHSECRSADFSEKLFEIFNKFSFEYEWALHGFTHLDSGFPQPQNSKKDEWKRKNLTAKEGEFLSINLAEQRNRIENGLKDFEFVFKQKPQGFVAPAWLYRERELYSLLKENNFSWTENHNEIVDLKNDKIIPAPVISWVTRSFILRNLALLVCPMLHFKNRNVPLLRIALHPRDFAFPKTIRNIENLLKKALNKREQILISQMCEK